VVGGTAGSGQSGLTAILCDGFQLFEEMRVGPDAAADDNDNEKSVGPGLFAIKSTSALLKARDLLSKSASIVSMSRVAVGLKFLDQRSNGLFGIERRNDFAGNKG